MLYIPASPLLTDFYYLKWQRALSLVFKKCVNDGERWTLVHGGSVVCLLTVSLSVFRGVEGGQFVTYGTGIASSGEL